MNYTVTDKIIDLILINRHDRPTTRRLVRKATGWGDTKIRETINKVIGDDSPSDFDIDPPEEHRHMENDGIRRNEEKDWAASLLDNASNYYFNEQDDNYVVYLKCASKNIVFPGEQIRMMLKAYSNWDGDPNTINEICRNFAIPRGWFQELKSIMGWTHDLEPVTTEELKTTDEDVIIEDLLQRKRLSIYQKFNKESWNETISKATKWDEFTTRRIDPFRSFLDSWKPPVYKPFPKVRKLHHPSDRTFVIGLSDLHFGSKASSDRSFTGKGQSTGDVEEAMKSYLNQIQRTVDGRVGGFGKAVIIGLGDQLHSLTGFTTKGTPLKFDCIKEEQYHRAFDSLVYFIRNIVDLFPSVEVKSVKGNHSDIGDYMLFEALKAYFRTESGIEFENFASDHGAFRIGKVLVLISHGASAEYKAKLPNGEKRQSYIQNLLMAKPELLVEAKDRIFISADQHHNEYKEYAQFTHYMLSTIVDSDEYADANGLDSRASQSCLVIDTNGVSEVLKYYFD